MKPEKVRGNTWKIDVPGDDETVLEKMAQIPGLRRHQAGWMEGPRCAVSVASKRMGGPEVKTHPVAVLVPSKLQLREYQQEGVSRLFDIMRLAGGALLADDMGLGKTRQSIATMNALNTKRIFVVCPGGVRETWREDLAKCGEEDVAVLGPATSRASKAEWKRAPAARWVITSYELSERAYAATYLDGAAVLPDALVMDEIHMLSGRKTFRTKRLQECAAQVNWRLGLTGTPFWNHPRDAWQLLDILLGRVFGSQWDFDLAYAGARLDSHGGWDNKHSTNEEEFKHRLSYYMVRRMKKDVLKELPGLTRQVVWVDAEQEATIAFHAAVLQRKSGSTSEAIESTLKGKMPEALRLAKELKQFLLFTWMKAHAQQMHKALEEGGTPCVLITGDVPDSKRKALVRLAATRQMGVVATIDAAGTGMDGLQHVASTGIFHALDWVPNKLAQAEARLHRLGQTAGVQWIYLAMKDSIDHRIVHSCLEKLDSWHKVMAGERGMSEAFGKESTSEDAEKEALRQLYAELPDE